MIIGVLIVASILEKKEKEYICYRRISVRLIVFSKEMAIKGKYKIILEKDLYWD